MKKNALRIAFSFTLFLISCDKAEPNIDYNTLLVGSWVEVKATDSYTDFIEPLRNREYDISDVSYGLEFKDNLKFSLSSSSIKVDSGDYYFSDKNLVHTTSVNNIRIPHVPTLPKVRTMTHYEILEITKEKLVLKSQISDNYDPLNFSQNTGQITRTRDMIWELKRKN